jgi:ureidoacrylate peracid hydrolase
VSDPSAVLLVVDMQNDFCHADGALAKRGADLGPTRAIVPALVKLIDRARAARVPVIYTANAHDEWTNAGTWRKRQGGEGLSLCRTGSWGAEFFGVKPAVDERVLIKHRYNAFVGTDLDLILRSRNIDTIYFTGVATNICVESTARDAFARNYTVTRVRDCLAGSSVEEHDWALRSLERYFGAAVADSASVAAAWASAPAVASR